MESLRITLLISGGVLLLLGLLISFWLLLSGRTTGTWRWSGPRTRTNLPNDGVYHWSKVARIGLSLGSLAAALAFLLALLGSK